MSLESTLLFDRNLAVVCPSGRLDQATNLELEKALQTLLEDGHYRIVVDMSNTTYINSGGLRILVSSWRQTRNHGGSLVLCGLKERLVEVFTMIGFDKVFNIYDDCQDALTSLTSDDAAGS